MGLDLASLAETVEPIKGRTVISVSPVGSALAAALGADAYYLDEGNPVIDDGWQ